MIADFNTGQKIIQFFILRNKELRHTRKKALFLSVELGDSTGRIFGSIWKEAHQLFDTLVVGKIVKVKAQVIKWQDRDYLSIENIRMSDTNDDVNSDNFIPVASTEICHLFQQYCELAKTIKNKNLSALFKNLLADEKISSGLKRAPGGKLWHHCYIGGLLEHTIHVARLIIKISEVYTILNKDLLLAGALLHDIGKITEYTSDGFINYSDNGRLHGHVVMGYNLVSRWISKTPEFPQELEKQLLHLILSHHGCREYGSPILPQTREAIVLFLIDELDSKLGAFERIYQREAKMGKKWSTFVKLLDRFFYFGNVGE